MNERRGKILGLWLPGILLTLSGVLLLSACGGKESSPSSSPSAMPAAVASSTPMAVATSSSQTNTNDVDNPSGEHTAWGTRREIDELYARVQRPIEDTRARPVYAEGKKIVVAEVTLTNESAEPKSCDAATFAAYDREGRRYESLSDAASKQALPSVDLEPGESVAGFLAFKVPRNATVERIVWGPLPVFEWVNEWTWE